MSSGAEGIRPIPRSWPRRVAASGGTIAKARDPLGLVTWLVMFYLVFEYGRPAYYVPALETIRLGIWLVLMGTFVLLIKRPHPLPREGWMLLGFLSLMVLGIPFAETPRYAFNATQAMVQMMLAGPFLMMVGLDTIVRLRRVLWVFVVMASIQSVQGIFHEGHGIGAFCLDENDLSSLLVIAIPISYFFLGSSRSWWPKLMAFLLFLICILGILAGGSRGGFVALCATALYVIVRSRRRFLALFAVLLAGMLLIPFIPQKWYMKMHTFETATTQGDTGEMRLYMWGVARDVFYAHPVMGVGPANFGRVAMSFQDPLEAEERGVYLYNYACHSLYFTTLAEMGLTGAIAFGTLIFFCFSTTTRVSAAVRKRMKAIADDGPSAELDDLKRMFAACRGLEGGMVGFLAAGTFLTVNFYPNCWTLVGLMSAVGVSYRYDPAFAGARA